MLSDLEITKLCAEAMGLKYTTYVDFILVNDLHPYNPLHDDAQAMALVKKFRLNIDENLGVGREWIVNKDGGPFGEGPDLNRAICECVAKMEAGRQFAQPHYGHDERA